MQLNRQNTSIFFKIVDSNTDNHSSKTGIKSMDRKNLTFSMFCKTSISIA